MTWFTKAQAKASLKFQLDVIDGIMFGQYKPMKFKRNSVLGIGLQHMIHSWEIDRQWANKFKCRKLTFRSPKVIRSNRSKKGGKK